MLFSWCAIVNEFFVIGDSDLFLIKNFHGRPLRPFLWPDFVSRGKQTHFKDETNTFYSPWIFGEM